MAELEPAPLQSVQVPCERCGTFVTAESLTLQSSGKICPQCSERVRSSVRLYPHGYIWALGLLGNFAVAAVLVAINWKRLGDQSRFRRSVGLAVIGVVVVCGQIALSATDAPAQLGCGLNLVGTFIAASGMKEQWQQHKNAGGARANLVTPILVLLGLIIVAVLIAVLALPDEVAQ